VWLEGLGQLKNPITSLGIEPATFRRVDRNFLHFFISDFHSGGYEEFHHVGCNAV
jgi:hypothetical protein